MLPKKNRLDKKTLENIFAGGKIVKSEVFGFRFIPGRVPGAYPRFAFVVPKSVARLAVKRNLLRRRGYRALEKHLKLSPNGAGVFIFKKPEEDILILQNDIEKIFHKFN